MSESDMPPKSSDAPEDSWKKEIYKEIGETRRKNRELKKAQAKWVLEDICAPIFDAAMGDRLKQMRMNLLLDQVALAKLLNLAPQTVSDLETGRISIPRFAFTVGKLRSIFGDATNYILFGTGAERINFNAIQEKFRRAKFYTERPKKEPKEHWTKRALREGYPRRRR